MNWWILGFLLHVGAVAASAQSFRFLEADAAVAQQQGSVSFLYKADYGVGQKQKFRIGWGIRFTSYLAKNRYYITAPATLTSGNTGPLVIFKPNIAANIDTLLLPTAQVNALNAVISLAYQWSERWAVAFNIDAAGFSFGNRPTGNYINGYQGARVSASPTRWNALLISDNDYGSLNSQFVAYHQIKPNWWLKGGAQFLFTEYTTATRIQQQPDANDRFRYKALMLVVGISRSLP